LKIREIGKLLDAQVLCGEDKLDGEVGCACGSDMMSEVLSFTKHEAALLTGLTNNHVLRTCEMLDIQCIVFVRGKSPTPEIIDMAIKQGCVLLATDKPMFTSCGILYSHGIKGGMREE
jgi:hypothetical protein